MIKKAKTVIYSILFILMLVITPVVIAETVVIEADKQDFNVEKNSAEFHGNVKLRFRDIKISSPRATLVTSPDGKPQEAIFQNGVVAQKNTADQQDELTAENLTMKLATSTMIAKGSTISKIKKGSPNAVMVKAERQEFDSQGNNIIASGNVQINYKDVQIYGSSAKLIAENGRPQKVVINGNSRITQNNSTINAPQITINLNSKEIIASGGVNSVTTLSGIGQVSMTSSHQHFNSSNNSVIGTGNVRVTYKDYIATGPKAVLTGSGGNTVDKLVFTGRSQITEKDRKVSADKITISFEPKSFKAEGNVKTQFAQMVNTKEILPEKKQENPQQSKKTAEKEIKSSPEKSTGEVSKPIEKSTPIKNNDVNQPKAEPTKAPPENETINTEEENDDTSEKSEKVL